MANSLKFLLGSRCERDDIRMLLVWSALFRTVNGRRATPLLGQMSPGFLRISALYGGRRLSRLGAPLSPVTLPEKFPGSIIPYTGLPDSNGALYNI